MGAPLKILSIRKLRPHEKVKRIRFSFRKLLKFFLSLYNIQLKGDFSTMQAGKSPREKI